MRYLASSGDIAAFSKSTAKQMLGSPTVELQLRSRERRVIRQIRYRTPQRCMSVAREQLRRAMELASASSTHDLLERYRIGRESPERATRILWQSLDQLLPYQVVVMASYFPDPRRRGRGRPPGTGYQKADADLMPVIKARITAGELEADVISELAVNHPGSSAKQVERRLRARYAEFERTVTEGNE